MLRTYESRIVNGLLKAQAAEAPEDIVRLLLRDIEIVADPRRAKEDDLWPAIWALAAVLERQFFGRVYIRAGLNGPLRQPARLGPQCRFETGPQDCLRIYLGCEVLGQGNLCGDAGIATVSYGQTLVSPEKATPTSCFALAGYLGFAALAKIAGVPAFREEFALSQISLPKCLDIPLTFPEPGFELVGLGHLGQAYIALLFFLTLTGIVPPRLSLIDKDNFENPNWSTQILIETQDEWIGLPKADYLRDRAKSWGWNATSEVSEITWDWRRKAGHPEIAVMGLDRFEPRRMVTAGGYSWIFDAGVGDSFLWPRVSWHSLPPDNKLAMVLFAGNHAAAAIRHPATPFINGLRETPGGCGLLTYEGIRASAPSMGLLASAFLWSEVMKYLSGEREQVKGSATIWTPIIPPYREVRPHGELPIASIIPPYTETRV